MTAQLTLFLGAESSGTLEDVNQNQTNVELTQIPQKSGTRPRRPVRLIIQQLCLFNDYLERHSTLLERKSLRYSLRIFCVSEQVSRLGMIRDAAALLGHKDIEQGAKACFVRRGVFDHNLVASFHVIEPKDLEHEKLIFGIRTSSAIYRGQKVLLDWFAVADKFRAPDPEVERKFYEPLAAILNKDLSALDLSIPRCVGCVKRNEGHSGISRYAFSVPDGAFKSKSKLQDLIPPKSTFDQPDLGSRFKLANALARTIFGMHLLDWSHGNLSTGNVVFCLQNEKVKHDLCHPYLLGFGLQEVYKSNRYKMIEADDRAKKDLRYRHPEFRDFLQVSKTGRATFKPSYDLYSLGVVLYEIGIWQTMGDLYGDVRDSRPVLTEEVIRNLRGHTGHRYTNAVIACLDGSFDSIWDTGLDADSKRLQDHLRQFQEKIVDPLAACSV